MSIPKDAPIKYATPMPPPSLQDIALVCPGGAAFFFVQAWELITILEARPDLVSRIRLIAANSAGSITGALLAYGIFIGDPLGPLKKALSAVKVNTDVINPDPLPVLAHPILHPITVNEMLFGGLTGSRVVSQTKLWELLDKFIGDFDTEELQRSHSLTLQVCSFDSAAGVGRVYSGYVRHLPKKSSAIEGFFQDHNGDSDGGPFDNCPADLAIIAGFEKILIPYCAPDGPDPDLRPILVSKDEPDKAKLLARNVVGALFGAMTALNENLTAKAVASWEKQGGQLVEAYPLETDVLGSLMDFTAEAQEKRKVIGIAAGQRALAKIAAFGW